MIDRRARSSLIARMQRAARLDVDVYEEVERDRNATGQAATVVLIAAVATGIGAFLGGGGLGAIVGIVGTFVGWIIWSLLTYWIGTTFFATKTTRVTPGEMLRTIGFAYTPGVLNILSFLPVLGLLVQLIVWLWQLIAGVIAVRQAMDFSTGRAIGTEIVGAIVQAILTGLWRLLT